MTFSTRDISEVNVIFFNSQVVHISGATPAFNRRQRDLLGHAIRHPSHQYTIKLHRTLQDVVYETARTDLLELQKRGLFLERGRKWFITAPEVLEVRLAGEDR